MKSITDKEDRIHVAAGIICRHGLMLAAQRPDEKPFGGFWELPGGKVENNESPGEALCRELAEELGINVKKFQPLGTVEHRYKESGFMAVLHFFRVSAFEGEPCNMENQNLRWIEPKDISELDFLPADKEILARLFSGSENTGVNSQADEFQDKY